MGVFFLLSRLIGNGGRGGRLMGIGKWSGGSVRRYPQLATGVDLRGGGFELKSGAER